MASALRSPTGIALARAAALADCGRREEAVAAARVAARLEPGAAAYVSELEKGGA
jgi:hypothetical protein